MLRADCDTHDTIGISGKDAVAKDSTFPHRHDLGEELSTKFLTRKILGNVGHPKTM